MSIREGHRVYYRDAYQPGTRENPLKFIGMDDPIIHALRTKRYLRRNQDTLHTQFGSQVYKFSRNAGHAFEIKLLEDGLIESNGSLTSDIHSIDQALNNLLKFQQAIKDHGRPCGIELELNSPLLKARLIQVRENMGINSKYV